MKGEKKSDRNQLPSIFPWSKPTVERRELKRVNQTEVKIQRKRRKVTNHNTVLHEEVRESGMQPACNSILEASEAGFHHCCVSYASVGTQTDEPMDLSEKKFQELYFVVYICLCTSHLFPPPLDPRGWVGKLDLNGCKVGVFPLGTRADKHT